MVNFAITGILSAIFSIVVGLIILIFPKSINYAIGFYLILMGILFFLSKLGI